MASRIILILLIAFLWSCSGDKTEEQPQKQKATQSAPAQAETRSNPPSTQDLQPDLHISGSPSTHTSGTLSTSEHMSGQ